MTARCCGMYWAMPLLSAVRTGSMRTLADFRPSREAVTTMGGGTGSVVRIRVERTATRLMPHSVSR